MIMHQATHTIPIVFVEVSDPVGSGLSRLGASGRQHHGLHRSVEPEMSGKWLGPTQGVCASSYPRARCISNPETADRVPVPQRAVETVAPSSRGPEADRKPLSTTACRHRACHRAFAQEPDGGLIVTPSPSVSTNRRFDYRVGGAAPSARDLPVSILSPTDGGLMSYGVDRARPISAVGSLCRSHPERVPSLASFPCKRRPRSSW